MTSGLGSAGSVSVTDQGVLARFASDLRAAYGDRLERAVLFGSRARGGARTDSDYDVAVFLNQMDSFNEEAKRLAAIETGILYDTGAVINSLPFRGCLA